ncbi:MAG TPA: dTDP-4-dehydrorhamnose reductase [Candidatus Acidoferrales bacterium]|nr:dTDP-4-dehydrorhamnose reductase [Candidatus Acidoferrales bacterium]
MTLRILLTGKNGQVGSELCRLLSPNCELTALGRNELDLANADDIHRAIAHVRPALIINAAAYTAVDQAEKEEGQARAINGDAPGVVAAEAKKIGASLIHYSTDYVFDGTKRSPYMEDDPTNPLSAYGRTKLAGEEAIRTSGVPHLILRTAWVYATSGKNFLLTILRLASTREELRIVNDQFGAPTPARAIALATARLVGNCEADCAGWFAENSGTYHLTAAGETTWYEFAVEILNTAHELVPAERPQDVPGWVTAATGGRPIIAKRVTPITTAEYPTPARRPAYSVLSNARFAASFGFSLPDWRSQLAETVQNAS